MATPKVNANIAELQNALMDILCLCVSTPVGDDRACWRALGAVQESAVRTLFGPNVPDCLKELCGQKAGLRRPEK